MPEACEVKTVAHDLNFMVANRHILAVHFHSGKYTRSAPKGFEQVVFPLYCTAVRSKGKMLIFDFADTDTKMFIGLGMTGTFDFVQKAHSHVEFVLNKEEPFPDRVWYNDPRQFGNIAFSTSDLSAKLAPGILDGITRDYFVRRGKELKTSVDVVSVLTDQEKLCSGIGNYLIAEILYEAKIDPFRKFTSLSEDELDTLYDSIIRISSLAFSYNGVSAKDYVAPITGFGTFQDHLKVYGRACTPSNEPVERTLRKGNRITWWVPSVQK